MKVTILDSIRKLVQISVDNCTETSTIEHALNKVVIIKESGLTEQDIEQANKLASLLNIKL